MPANFDVAIAPLLWRRMVTGQGGLITGTDPAAFTTTDPLRLWIIQVGIIIVMTQLLSLTLRRLRQPKVVAEILGGILLGPTAFGRIPGFTKHIFPPVSLPYLFLVANIGLCLFLFLVGLAIDISVVKRNAHMSAIVTLTSIILPFGLGSALSIPLYHHFIDPSVHFTYSIFFVGLAYSITAFPVLCPMLTELKLLNTNLGVIVLSAGFGNAIHGWVLLSLGVALVNAASALTALWILLTCISFTILLIPTKFALRWLAHKTGSIENGPSMFFMTITMVLFLACCLFTDSIGVNAILGAFLFGLVVPREGGLTISLTEKLEDMVTIVFLPLYFTFSGLNTNLWLLDNGITWAFTIVIILVSFTGKFGGCMTAARLSGCNWRESSTIGAFMSCKGLLELIVLNVGLQAGVLSQRLFSMFVLEAVTLTFITTPLVTALNPPERRIGVGETAPPVDSEHGQPNEKESMLTEGQPCRHRFMVVLDKLDHIPGAMALTQLVIPPRSVPSDGTSSTETSGTLTTPRVSVEALQLIEFSDRTSAITKSSAADSLIHTDPMLGIFRMFGELNELTVTTSLSVVPYDDFPCSVAEHAHRHASHLILLPWSPFAAMMTMDAPYASVPTPKSAKSDHNPFDVLFGSIPGTNMDRSLSVIHSQFVRGVFAQSKTDVALFIDTGDRSEVGLGGSVHVFLPFLGGPDDRLALEFVVQLCLNPRITATVVRIVRREEVVDEGVSLGVEPAWPPLARLGTGLDNPGGLTRHTERWPPVTFPDTPYDRPTTQMRLESETTDHIIWSKYASPSDNTSNTKTDTASRQNFCQALSRIHFSETPTPSPVHAAIDHTRALQETSPCLLIVAGRSLRLAQESHHAEMKRILEISRSGIGPVGLEGMCKTIGDVGTAITIATGRPAVVLQAVHAMLD